MLSAEQYALENKAVQSMMSIRERELNFIDQRLGALGTQAALVGGFMVGGLKLIPDKLEHGEAFKLLLFFQSFSNCVYSFLWVCRCVLGVLLDHWDWAHAGSKMHFVSTIPENSWSKPCAEWRHWFCYKGI
jgi:hypothetical protein